MRRLAAKILGDVGDLEVGIQPTKEHGPKAIVSGVLEIAANFATLVVAGVLTVVLLRSYNLPIPAAPAKNLHTVSLVAPVTAGSDMSMRIPAVNWHANGRTLVLVLSTRCHFCTESAPFFRRLGERAGSNVKFLAVLRQPVAESERYLSGEGLYFDEIRQALIGETGAAGTPTLLLVDQDGIVKRTWVGRLAPDKEREALDAIIDPHLAPDIPRFLPAVADLRQVRTGPAPHPERHAAFLVRGDRPHVALHPLQRHHRRLSHQARWRPSAGRRTDSATSKTTRNECRCSVLNWSS
jgi:hypothetical protein